MNRRLAAISVALGLLVGGCGSGSSSKSTGSTVGDARASYIAGADKACASVQAQQNSLRQQASGLTLTQLVPVLRRQAGIAAHLAAMLQSIPHPASDNAPIGRYISAIKAIGSYSAALANATVAGHTSAALGIRNRLLQVKTAEHFLGLGYGYKICTTGTSY